MLSSPSAAASSMAAYESKGHASRSSTGPKSSVRDTAQTGSLVNHTPQAKPRSGREMERTSLNARSAACAQQSKGERPPPCSRDGRPQTHNDSEKSVIDLAIYVPLTLARGAAVVSPSVLRPLPPFSGLFFPACHPAVCGRDSRGHRPRSASDPLPLPLVDQSSHVRTSSGAIEFARTVATQRRLREHNYRTAKAASRSPSRIPRTSR
jgi:hypothetical protein